MNVQVKDIPTNRNYLCGAQRSDPTMKAILVCAFSEDDVKNERQGYVK